MESKLTYQYSIVFEEKCDLSESLGLVLVYFWQGTDLLAPPSNQHRQHLRKAKEGKLFISGKSSSQLSTRANCISGR